MPLMRYAAGLVPAWAWALAIGGVVASASIWHFAKVDAARDAGRDEIREQWRAAQAEEDQRHAARLTRQMEVTDAEIQRREAAEGERDRLRRAADGLRARLAAAGARQDPAAASGGQAAGADPGVLAELLGRCVERVRALADHADAARGAGAACEASYDALTSPP